jgi:sigma-B regulation protein RsbU (phosphoserine phosphatase)
MLGSGALPLGIRPDREFVAEEVVIDPCDVLLLYTDGVVETLNAAGESFGFDRLRELLAAAGTSRSVHDRVLRELDLFRGREPVYDDRSLAVMTRHNSGVIDG